MLTPCEWRDAPYLFEDVTKALEKGNGFSVTASSEHSEYGDHGYIIVTTQDGRRFYLSLHRES